MKIKLILSGVLLFPFILLSLSIGTSILLIPDIYPKGFNLPFLLVCSVILCIAVSVITITTMGMIKYTSKIDKLDTEIENEQIKQKELHFLINKYNKLISEQLKNTQQ